MPTNPLQPMHEQAEASFLPYGPDVQIVESYGEMEAEYAAIRKAAGLMDAPHRSVVVLTGKDRLTFLNNILTNETRKLSPGQGAYAFLLNLKGRITLDVNILQREDATLLEVDTRLAATLCKELEKYLFSEDVKLLDASDQLGRMSLIGPGAGKLLSKVMEGPLDHLTEPLQHTRGAIAKATVTVFRSDAAGEVGYELVIPRDQLVQTWQVLHEAGGHDHDDATLRAIGWSAFNTARIEAGTPLYGIDLTDNYLPMETGHWYARAVAVSKGCYVGQEIVARMHAHKAVARLFVGLRLEEDKLPLAGAEILDGANAVGIVTSSCMSPMLGFVPVAMGYVKKTFAAPGTQLEILADGGRAKAKVVELPFWKK